MSKRASCGPICNLLFFMVFFDFWFWACKENQQDWQAFVVYPVENNYKALLIIPFLLLFLAFAQIGFQYATTGDFMNKGVFTFEGGTDKLIDMMVSELEKNGVTICTRAKVDEIIGKNI